jgi:CheY-like chemotaxis protein
VIDLSTHLRGMHRLLERVAGDRNQLCLDLTEDCRVRVDPGQLEQAVVNLVANATDAMPEGGRCTITVERVPATGTPLRVLLHVADTGAGMSDEIAARAFEPFFTTKPRGQGTGLGLASVHGMAQQSDGNASVRSVPGAGTCVTIDLPWTDEPAAITPTSTITAPMKTGPYTILVAEDDNGTRRVVERILANAGYVVHNAADGSEAMAMIEDAARNFDLVLSDVMMPGHTGPEIADRLAVLRPQTPVLLMTGYAEEQLAALLDTSVKREIITKPFSAEALTSRVAMLLRTLSTSGQHAG